MKRRAFISVYDKVGLIEFAKNLVEKFDYEIVASGETFEVLKNAEIEVINAAEFSSTSGLLTAEYNFLSETILAAVLANSSDSKLLTDLERVAVKPFDMVVVNLCPFEKLALESSDTDEVISKIDISGITLMRAAAKNYKNVTVITDKIDYYLA